MKNRLIYSKAKRRVARTLNAMNISDFDIIVELEKEINQYRKQIESIRNDGYRVVIDSDGMLIKRVSKKQLKELLEEENPEMDIKIFRK